MNGAGCPNGWQAQSSPAQQFRHHNYCSSWQIRSVRDDRALRRGDSAGTSMYAGTGARFTGFSIRSRGTARNGTSWNIAMCRTPYASCAQYLPQSGSWNERQAQLGTLAPGGSASYAQHLWAGVRCNQDKCPDSTSAGRAVDVTHLESHAVVEDYTAPGTPAVGGISGGWNSGEKHMNYFVTDAGSGIASVTLSVDGSLHRTVNHSCARLPTGGYTTPVPCATATGNEFTVNEPGQLADGHHSLTVTSRDAGGAARATTKDFWVDNNAPGHPIDLAVTGGDGWRRTNDFSVTWENPDQGNGSEIAGAYYKVGSAPETPTDGTRVSGPGSVLDGVRVPRDGDWTVHVWLEDAAGNADPGNAIAVHARLDTTSPSLAFANEQTAAEVRVHTSDAHSGVTGGQIEIRRQGVPEWRELETRREGTDLVAAIPDDQLPRGTYELRAIATDAVGNTAITTRRANGQAMVVDLPLRTDTSLGASLSRRAGGAGGGRRTMRIGYRKRAWLRGVLRAGGALMPDTRVLIETRRLTRRAWQPLTEVVTDGSGRYAVRLPRGASREVRVRFAGNRSLQPAAEVARLLVRGWASLRLEPRSLRRGGTITFRGQIGLFRARVPATGKLIQYLDGRRWRPAVKLGHTGRRGRFAIRYRFRRISRPTRIYFRILVPAEGGWPYATGASRVRTAFVRP